MIVCPSNTSNGVKTKGKFVRRFLRNRRLRTSHHNAIPLTRNKGNQRSNLGGFTRFLLIVAFAKVFFEPDVEADKEVTATHFVDLEFGGPGATIALSNWNHGPGITAHDCF